SVSSSNSSSSVPKPPGKRTNASASFMNISFRVKKYLKLMSLGSEAMNGLGLASNGSTMLTPNELSWPAPSLAALMIPGPAPVTRSSKAERASTGYSSSSSTRALRRRSSSASPVEYWRRVRAAGPRVALCFAMIHLPWAPHHVGSSPRRSAGERGDRARLKAEWKGRNTLAIRYVAFDGDDTLWHNETRFNLTQSALRDLIRRHVPDADVDSELAEVEKRNLGLYGYGVKAFTLSMLETAIQVTKARIPTADLEVILGWGKRMLGEPTELFDGVEDALRDVGSRCGLL